MWQFHFHIFQSAIVVNYNMQSLSSIIPPTVSLIKHEHTHSLHLQPKPYPLYHWCIDCWVDIVILASWLHMCLLFHINPYSIHTDYFAIIWVLPASANCRPPPGLLHSRITIVVYVWCLLLSIGARMSTVKINLFLLPSVALLAAYNVINKVVLYTNRWHRMSLTRFQTLTPLPETLLLILEFIP